MPTELTVIRGAKSKNIAIKEGTFYVPILFFSGNSMLFLNFEKLLEKELKRIKREKSEKTLILTGYFNALWELAKDYNKERREQLAKAFGETIGRKIVEAFNNTGEIFLKNVVLDKKRYKNLNLLQYIAVDLTHNKKTIPKDYFEKLSTLLNEINNTFLKNEEYERALKEVSELSEIKNADIVLPELHITENSNYFTKKSEEYTKFAIIVAQNIMKEIKTWSKERANHLLASNKKLAEYLALISQLTIEDLRKKLTKELFPNKRIAKALDNFIKNDTITCQLLTERALRIYILLELLLSESISYTLLTKLINTPPKSVITADRNKIALIFEGDTQWIEEYRAMKRFLHIALFEKEGKELKFNIVTIPLLVRNKEKRKAEKMIKKLIEAIIGTIEIDNTDKKEFRLKLAIPEKYSPLIIGVERVEKAPAETVKNSKEFKKIAGRGFKSFKIFTITTKKTIQLHFTSVEDLKAFLNNKQNFKKNLVKALYNIITP